MPLDHLFGVGMTIYAYSGFRYEFILIVLFGGSRYLISDGEHGVFS